MSSQISGRYVSQSVVGEPGYYSVTHADAQNASSETRFFTNMLGPHGAVLDECINKGRRHKLPSLRTGVRKFKTKARGVWIQVKLSEPLKDLKEFLIKEGEFPGYEYWEDV